MRAVLRALCTASVVLMVAIPSWTLSARDEAFSVEEARDRYYSLDPEERDRIHASYEQFKALSADEQDDLRDRAKNLARLSRQVESDLPEEVARELAERTPRERRRHLRQFLRAQAKDHGMRLRERMPETSVRELEEKRGVHERAAYLKRYKRENLNRVIGEMVRNAGRKLDVPADRIEEIANRESMADRMRGLLELNVGLTEEEVLAMGLPFQITPQQWSEWQSMPEEEFFHAVLLHRSRLTAKRQQAEGRVIERPSDKEVRALNRLVKTVRKRVTDFIELDDLNPRRARIRLEKRKRSICFRIIRDAELQSAHLISELEVMNDADFYSRVREILMHHGGPQQITAWAAELRGE